jgi:hypothetical protein
MLEVLLFWVKNASSCVFCGIRRRMLTIGANERQRHRFRTTSSGLHEKFLSAFVGSDALALQDSAAAACHHFAQPGGRNALAVV